MLKLLDYKKGKLIEIMELDYDAALVDILRGEIRHEFNGRYTLIWETPK